MDRLLSMRVFERVVDEGSFAGAARALDMSPPVVTRLVADLEDHLGTRLLQRSTRRLSLTDAGQTYLNRVRSILLDIDEAHAVTKASNQELTGLLRLHATPVLASRMVAPILTGFLAKYPGIQVDIDVATADEATIEDFDITLLPADESFDANIVARKVFESQSILVAAPGYLKIRGTPRTPQELAAHDCLQLKVPYRRYRVWRMWPEHASPDQALDIEITPVLSANHAEALFRAAVDGAGITTVAMDLVAPYLAEGSLVRVLSPWITGGLSVYAALPSRKFIPQRTRAFLDYLMERMHTQNLTLMKFI